MDTLQTQLAEVVDRRCNGCPAILAADIGREMLKAGACENQVKPATARDGETGCLKGPVDESLILRIIK